jgi:ArsR family transcriptional regulator, lead/cadmium/zinc/bismuth-responsive transcriptional repressor
MNNTIRTNSDLIRTATPDSESQSIGLDPVHRVQSDILSTAKAQRMAEFFGVLADPHRLKLLSALACQELCVCDLAAIVEMSESAVSHQLRILRSMAMVKHRREGRNIYYDLADSHIVNLYHEVAEHRQQPRTEVTGHGA